MDLKCDESIRYKRDASEARKNDCARKKGMESSYESIRMVVHDKKGMKSIKLMQCGRPHMTHTSAPFNNDWLRYEEGGLNLLWCSRGKPVLYSGLAAESSSLC